MIFGTMFRYRQAFREEGLESCKAFCILIIFERKSDAKKALLRPIIMSNVHVIYIQIMTVDVHVASSTI